MSAKRNDTNGSEELDLEFEEEDESGNEGLDVPLAQRRLVTTPYDLSVKTLVSQFNDKSLVVPSYQRQYIWTDTDASRLIESLLLNVPIPVLYFQEEDSGQYSIIDGHQRVRSLVRYLNGEFALQRLRVLRELNGFTFSQLDQKQQRIIQNRTIRCIVIMSESHPEIQFDIFERLNRGAAQLNPQELRNAMYRGDLNDFMKDLINDPNWLTCIDATEPDERMQDVELVLRFFALHDNWSVYRPPLKSFLNKYMRDRRKMSETERSRLSSLWHHAVENTATVFGNKAFRRYNTSTKAWDKNINRALFDAIMITMSQLELATVTPLTSNIAAALQQLCDSPDFVKAIALATGDRSRLLARLGMWNDELIKLGLDTGLRVEFGQQESP